MDGQAGERSRDPLVFEVRPYKQAVAGEVFAVPLKITNSGLIGIRDLSVEAEVGSELIATSPARVIESLKPGSDVLVHAPMRTRGKWFYTGMGHNVGLNVSYKIGDDVHHQLIQTTVEVKPAMPAILFSAIVGAFLGLAIVFARTPPIQWFRSIENREVVLVEGPGVSSMLVNFTDDILFPAMYGAFTVFLIVIVAAMLAAFLFRGESRTSTLGISVTNHFGAFVVGLLVAVNGLTLVDAFVGAFRDIGA